MSSILPVSWIVSLFYPFPLIHSILRDSSGLTILDSQSIVFSQTGPDITQRSGRLHECSLAPILSVAILYSFKNVSFILFKKYLLCFISQGEPLWVLKT